MKPQVLAIVSAVFVMSAGLLATTSTSEAPAPEAKPQLSQDDWLLGAPDDAARFKLIQSQARGFSAAMVEVGRRYEGLHGALNDKNYDLAAYQWQKIKEVIVAGYTRRPKRQANADAILVQKIFEPVLADLKLADDAKAWAAFDTIRGACMACHEAEKVGFMNNQPLFRLPAKSKP